MTTTTTQPMQQHETETYWFQNPNSGWPMYLTWCGKRAAVLTEELDDAEAPPSDEEDADAMTAAVRGCESLYDAARLLKKWFGAADILD